MSFKLIIENRLRSLEADVEAITSRWKNDLIKLIDAHLSASSQKIYNNVVSKPMAEFLITQMENSKGNVNDFNKLGVEITFNAENATNGDITIENIYWDQFAKSIGGMSGPVGDGGVFDKIDRLLGDLKNTKEVGCNEILQTAKKGIEEIGKKIKNTNNREEVAALARRYQFLNNLYWKCKSAMHGFDEVKKGYRPFADPKKFRGYSSDTVYQRLRLSGRDVSKFRELVKTKEWNDFIDSISDDKRGGGIKEGSRIPEKYRTGKEILTDDGKIVYNPYYIYDGKQIDFHRYNRIVSSSDFKYLNEMTEPIWKIGEELKNNIETYSDGYGPQSKNVLVGFIDIMRKIFFTYWSNPKRFLTTFELYYTSYVDKDINADDISYEFIRGTYPPRIREDEYDSRWSGIEKEIIDPDITNIGHTGYSIGLSMRLLLNRLSKSNNQDGKRCYSLFMEYIKRYRGLVATLKNAFSVSENLFQTYFKEPKQEYVFTRDEMDDIKQTINGNFLVAYYLNSMVKVKMEEAADPWWSDKDWHESKIEGFAEIQDSFEKERAARETNMVILRLTSDMKKHDAVSNVIFNDLVAKEINKVVSRFGVNFEYAPAFPGGVSDGRLELENIEGEMREILNSINDLKEDFGSGTSSMTKQDFDQRLEELNHDYESRRLRKNFILMHSEINDVRKHGEIVAITLDNYKTILSEMDSDAIESLKKIINEADFDYAGLT